MFLAKRTVNKRARRDFTREELAKLISYDPDTGILTWIVPSNSPRGRRPPGAVAGSDNQGYVNIALYGKLYRGHHLAWFLTYGEWPPKGFDIDHIDRNRCNNRLSNLRIASRAQNNMNMGIRSDNKSGHKGVGLRKDTGKWYARVKAEGRIICLGHFDTYEEAVACRKEAERKYYGEFAS